MTLSTAISGLAPGRALDVGAGEGGDALWLAARGWSVTASDISQRALDRVGAEAGCRGLRVECRRADANAAGAFETAAFDLVSAQSAASGHPWLSLLAPDEAAGLALDAGFGDVHTVTSADLHDRYFADRHDGLSPAGGEDLVIATAGGG